MAHVYYDENDHIVHVVGLLDRVEQLKGNPPYQNDATVKITALRDDAGVDLTGITLPLDGEYITGSDGDYVIALPRTLVVSIGQTITITVQADTVGSARAEWTIRAAVQSRPGAS